MAVGFRSSSIRGTSDQFSTSVAIPVPSGSAAGDVVVCFVGQWDSAGAFSTVTPPAGFTLVGTALRVTTRVSAYWKRLTGSDTGNYTFTLSAGEWSNGSAVATTGGVTTGDPVEDFDAGGVTGTAYPALSVTTVSAPILVWGAYNASGDGTHDVPDSFTGIAAQDYGMTAWRVPGTTGAHSATGATAGSSMDLAAILVAVAAEPTGGSDVLGQASSTESGRPLSRSKTRILGQAVETAVARLLTGSKRRGIAAAVDTETATALGRRKLRFTGQAVDTHVATALGRAKARLLAAAVEVDSAHEITAAGAALGRATENDIALPVGRAKTRVLGIAVEAAAATALGRTKRRGTGQAVETDAAAAIGRARLLGQAVEAGTATSLARLKRRLLDQAVEADQALPVGTPDRLGLAAETDVALPLGRSKTRLLGQAVETASSSVVARVKARLLGQPVEVDSAVALLVPVLRGTLDPADRLVPTAAAAARPVPGMTTTRRRVPTMGGGG